MNSASNTMSTSPRPGQKQQQPHRSLLPKKIASAEFKESLAMNAAEDCLARNKNANVVFDAASVLAALSGGSLHNSSSGLAEQQNSATGKADCESSGQKRQLRHTISQTDSKSNSTSNLSAMSSSQSGGKSNTDQRPAKKAKQSLKSDVKNQPSKKSKSTEKKSSSKRKASNHLPNDLPIAPKERHIPSYKKSSCALTFPEKLMSMLDYAEEMKGKCVEKGEDPEKYCLTWMPDGESFLVRDPTACTQNVIPMFFKMAKFTSITRKLYRWGFHQVERDDADGTPLPPESMIFANDFFKRDARHEIANMRSTTAASQKRKLKSTVESNGDSINEEVIMEEDGNVGDTEMMVSFDLEGSPRDSPFNKKAKKEIYNNGSTTTSEAGSSEMNNNNSPKSSSTPDGEWKPAATAAVGLTTKPQIQELSKTTTQLQDQHQPQLQQQQQVLQMLLMSCNGDLSRLDPKLLESLKKKPSTLLVYQGITGINNNAPMLGSAIPNTSTTRNNNQPTQYFQHVMSSMNNRTNPVMTMQQQQQQQQQQYMQRSLGFAAQTPPHVNNTHTPAHQQQQQQQQQVMPSTMLGGVNSGLVLPGTNIVITPAMMSNPAVQQLIAPYFAGISPIAMQNTSRQQPQYQQQPMASFQGMPFSPSVGNNNDKAKVDAMNWRPSAFDQPNNGALGISPWALIQNGATPNNNTIHLHNGMNSISPNQQQAAAMAMQLSAQQSQGGFEAQQALATLIAASTSETTGEALNKKPESSPQVSSIQQNPAAASLPVQPMQQMQTSAPSLGNLTAVLGPLLANLSPEQQTEQVIQMLRRIAESLEKEKVQSQEQQIQSMLSMLQNHAATSSNGQHS